MSKTTGVKAIALAVFSLCILCAFSWYWGFQIGATSLSDPDTCWLLAVGRWIAMHHALPSADTFAWTPPLIDSWYLPYQWLSTLIFFGFYKMAGAPALLYLVSFLVYVAFFCLPLFCSQRIGNSLPAQTVRSALALCAASFHFPLRPEIFSYVIISALVWYLLETLLSRPGQPQQTPRILAIHAAGGALLFALWANLHSAFALGLIIVAALTLACSLAGRGKILTLPAFLGGAALGTLLNPFGFNLYRYLPGLFFSPVNKYNMELLPLRPGELLSSDYLPYLILQIIFLVSVCAIFLKVLPKRSEYGDRPHILPALFVAALLTCVLFVSGDLCRRMIPFAVLVSFMHFQMAWHLVFGGGNELKLLIPFDEIFTRLKVHTSAQVLICLALLVGTGASAYIFPLSIPQSTFGFQRPTGAEKFIATSRPPGKLCNDAQYGDVLIFTLDRDAQVFIDTRFDMYGPKFCMDYVTLSNALPGYEKLLDSYKIDWVFFPRSSPLISKLEKNGNWKTVYSDRDAAILSRLQGAQ